MPGQKFIFSAAHRHHKARLLYPARKFNKGCKFFNRRHGIKIVFGRHQIANVYVFQDSAPGLFVRFAFALNRSTVAVQTCNFKRHLFCLLLPVLLSGVPCTLSDNRNYHNLPREERDGP